MPRTQQVLRKSGQNPSAPPRGLQSTSIGVSLRGLAPLINRPSITLTPWPHPLLPLLLSFNSSSLTNPSFQEREADLFWGRASGAVCAGTTGGCHSQETMGLERQGESSPCRISLLNPLLWLAPSQQRKGTKFPGRLWQAAPLSAGQKLIPSSSPVPPTQGAGLMSLAFCVSLSGGVKGREQETRGWSNHQCSSTDRRTDRCPVLGLTPPGASAPRSCLVHTGKEGGPQCLQPPHGNGGDRNHSGTRAQEPLIELLAAQPGTKRSFHGVGCPTWLVEEGEGLNSSSIHHERPPPAPLQWGWGWGRGQEANT